MPQCPDCGGERANEAFTCPNCGRPGEGTVRPPAREAFVPAKKTSIARTGCLSAVGVLGFLTCVGLMSDNSQTSSRGGRYTAPAAAPVQVGCSGGSGGFLWNGDRVIIPARCEPCKEQRDGNYNCLALAKEVRGRVIGSNPRAAGRPIWIVQGDDGLVYYAHRTMIKK